MFGFGKRKELEETNTALCLKLAEVSACLDKVRKELQELKDQKECSVSVNFNNIDAFCIERLDGKTNIGFWTPIDDNKKEIGEWYIQCNEETHEQIVNEFNNHCRLT